MNYKNKLVKAIQEHKLVVVLDLPLTSLREDELSKKHLVKELNKRFALSQDLSFEQMVEFGWRKQGKEQFLSFLNRIMNNTEKKAPQYYRILEALGIKYIIETHYSSLFRIEMEESGKDKNYLFCHRRDDFPFHESTQIIVALFGKTDYHSEDLILTGNDYNDFFADINSVSPSLRSIFKNTILFIDFDPSSDRFKRIYDFICRRNGTYPSEAFLISAVEQDLLPYGPQENLTIVKGDALNLLNEVAMKIRESVPSAGMNDDKMDSLSPLPYKYLHSYEQGDCSIFFGREKEVSELSLRVRGSHQITIMTASSGYGKTSMINAGLIPALEKTNDYSIHYVRTEENPWESIVRDVFHMKPQDFLSSMSEMQGFFQKKYQLIIIDQFEECFISNSLDSLHEIDDRMKELLHHFPTLSLLISIRQDFYTRLPVFQFLGDTQIKATYNLPPLTISGALDAIQKPTEFKKYQFSYEAGLADYILESLSVEGDDGNSCVDPSQLQIVCYFLYQELQIRKKSVITAEIYNELGKANGILENYIETSLKKYSYSETRRQLGKEILKCLVSSKNTRISKSTHEIYMEIAAGHQSDTRLEDEITFMIAELVEARLVRVRTISEEVKKYELTHEYIIHKINEWMDADTLRFKETKEFFRMEYQKWFLYHGEWSAKRTIMPSNLFDEVQKYRDRIDFSPQEESYMLLCLISYTKYTSEDMKYWISRNRGNPYCEQALTCAMMDFRGRKRIFAGVLLSVLLPEERVFLKIYEALSENINPHFLKVAEEIKALGEKINEVFEKQMYDFLNHVRRAGMCPINGGCQVRLGLTAKASNDIVKKRDLGKYLRAYFPDEERIVSPPLYYMDKYAVTNRQYAEFDENHHYIEAHAEYPVVGIDFEHAREYARWWGKDLPTEDEWEYAARGNDFRFFPWGSDWDYKTERQKAEHKKRCNTSLTGTDGVRRVDEYPEGASPFGCLNMSGNVWEWTTTEAEEGSDRLIIKGGSWSQLGIEPWTWYRYSYSKANGYTNVGFRCVLREKL